MFISRFKVAGYTVTVRKKTVHEPTQTEALYLDFRRNAAHPDKPEEPAIYEAVMPNGKSRFRIDVKAL